MKKLNYVATILFAILFALFIVSCGGSETNGTENDEATNDADSAETVDENASDADTIVDITTLDYPETGTTTGARGDITTNLVFFDELDRERALAEWFKGNNPDSKLIWLVVSTYDCPYCVVEKRDLPKMNKQDYKDRGFSLVVVMNGLLSGPQTNLEPEKVAALKDSNIFAYGEEGNYAYGFLKSQTGLSKLGLQGYPHNILIDATNMKILDVFGGWDTSLIEKYDKFIDFMLDDIR